MAAANNSLGTFLDATPAPTLESSANTGTSAPRRTKKKLTKILPKIIHEQEDMFAEIDDDEEEENAATRAQRVPPVTTGAGAGAAAPPIQIVAGKRRSKRASSTASTDARDKFKTRSISDPVSVSPFSSVPTKNAFAAPDLEYSLDLRRPFASNFRKFSHNISYISPLDYVKLVNWYYSKELPPVETMFPWLHGLHRYNQLQRKFLSQHIVGGDLASVDHFKVPIKDVRFLTTIRSCAMASHLATHSGPSVEQNEDTYMIHTGVLKGTIPLQEVLVPLLNTNLTTLRETVATVFLMLGIAESENFSKNLIVEDCLKLKCAPIFKELDPLTGVSLRNFHIQTSKISHISDFVVYCFNEHLETCACHSLLRLLKMAQWRFQRDHPEVPKDHFNVFVLHGYDPFVDAGRLIAVPPITFKQLGSQVHEHAVFKDWSANTLFKEKLEIAKMSSATHVYREVWFGNLRDFESVHEESVESVETVETVETVDNVDTDTVNTVDNVQDKTSPAPFPPPANHSPPLYCSPSNTITTVTGAALAVSLAPLVNAPPRNWKLFVNCYDGAKFPYLSELRDYLVHCDDDYYDSIYLEFPPSGSIADSDLHEDKVASVLNLCKLLHFTRFSSLIYCLDGYSESSLLGLCYVIYAENLSLDEAILKLHKHYGRPFFIFKSDYAVLRILQVILRRYSPKLPGYRFERTLDVLDKNVMAMVMMPSRFDRQLLLRILDNHSLEEGAVPADDSDGSSDTSSADSDAADSDAADSDAADSDAHSQPLSCFEQVSGSLPSRILPHLYLGSLNHASNLALLRELGITKVVSVGERLGWVLDYEFLSRFTESGCKILDLCGAVSPDPLVKEPCHVQSLMYISNINDDGIGTLTKTINDTLLFVDELYAKHEKVLVHCQVGVSRSATVCIAEVMKRLNVSLIRAYLYVRVRRLNVIIQPNLKLTYELFKWEENVVKSKLSRELARDDARDNPPPERSSFNSLFSSSNSTKHSISRSSVSTSISSASGSLDNNIDKAFFSFRVKDNSYQTLKLLSKNQVFISDDELDVNEAIMEDEDEDNEVVSDVSGHRTLKDEDNDTEELIYNGLITDNKYWVREVDWAVLCKEIYELNKAYISHG